MARKMNKKTRNVLSGILVGIASVFAVINFADIPAADVRSFILATLLFFAVIVALAFLAVTGFKLLAWTLKKLAGKDGKNGRDGKDDEPWTASEDTDQDDSDADRS